MDLSTIFKDKKAFSLVELVIAMLLASIVMLSIYFMLVVAYDQFNDLTEESERFNNLQVFERMFQRSAMTCSYFEIQKSTFSFYHSNKISGKTYYEQYVFDNIKDKDFCRISTFSAKNKMPIYLEQIETLSNLNTTESYKLSYYKNSGSISYGNSKGYLASLSVTKSNDSEIKEQKVLFDNIVKVYYEISTGITTSKFDLFTGKNFTSNWKSNGFNKIYTPFIKVIIIYKDNRGRLRRTYITCRLRGIEGTEFQI